MSLLYSLTDSPPTMDWNSDYPIIRLIGKQIEWGWCKGGWHKNVNGAIAVFFF